MYSMHSYLRLSQYHHSEPELMLKCLIPSKEPGSGTVIISETVVHWSEGAEWRGYLWPSACGGGWCAGEPGIAHTCSSAQQIVSRVAAVADELLGKWERARLQTGFGARTVITPDSVWFGIQWCARPT